MPLRNLLKSAPPAAVRSLDELFAIAHAMEEEAATHYTQLAERMRSEGHPQLADLFDRLAADEKGHESSVLSWSQRQSGKAPDASAIRWELPKTFDEETAAELASSRLINAYRVLSMAVRNEERAFTLWSYIAAEAATPEIREAAERMAREELEHVSLLRRARRSAYHAERATRPREGATSIDTILAEAAVLEAALADQLQQLESRLTGGDARRAKELAEQARAMAGEAAAMSSAPDRTPMGEEGDAQATAERLVETYLDIGDRSRDEALVARVQVLARQAIARLAWLRLIA
jgi:rubrerythrin